MFISVMLCLDNFYALVLNGLMEAKGKSWRLV